MLLRSVLIASSFAMAASVATAATVTIDLTSGTTTGVVSGAPPLTQGTISQNGFDVAYSYVDDGVGAPGSLYNTTVPAVSLLSDCGPFGGCGAYSTQLTISKSGGGTFSLSSVDAAGTYEGFSVDAAFTPFLSDGTTLDFGNMVTAGLPVLRDSLMFTGTKSDGTVVTVSAATASPGNVSAAGTGPFAFTGTLGADSGFGPSQATFKPGDLAQLSDLIQLSLAIDTTPFTLNLAALKSLQDFGVPLEILQGVNQCGFTSCTIPGFGQFDFLVDLTGGRNDTLAVQLAGITLDTPAPVPLPATAVLLLAGLGLLGAARARGRV